MSDYREGKKTDDGLLQVLTGMRPEAKKQCAKALRHHMTLFESSKPTEIPISKKTKLKRIGDAKRQLKKAKKFVGPADIATPE